MLYITKKLLLKKLTVYVNEVTFEKKKLMLLVTFRKNALSKILLEKN